MVHPQDTQKSLQQRVNDMLRGTPQEYVVEESGLQSIEDITTLLQKAEGELRTHQARVDLLKWELERVRS